MKSLLITISLLFALTVNSQNYYINEDFNSGSLPSGWTTTAITGSQAWSFGLDGSNGNSSAVSSGMQNIDSTSFAYFDDDVLGAGSSNNFARLLTPTFDNSLDTICYLEFDYNFKELSTVPSDSFYVEVFDGSSWVKVLTKTTDDCGHYTTSCINGFPHARIDISNYTNSNCQVRFTYYDGNDWAWYAGVDNVEVHSTPYIYDLEVLNIEGFKSCSLSSNEQINVTIKNNGTDFLPATIASISYQFRGNTATERINQNILSGDTIQYSFTTTADLSSVQGKETLTAWVTNPSDTIRSNDTLSTNVETYIHLPNYYEDFEDFEKGANYNSDNLQSWVRTPSNTSTSQYIWHVEEGIAPNAFDVNNPTGPTGDATDATSFKNGDGKYMLIESNLTSSTSGPTFASLELPCGPIDFTQSKNGKILLEFNYHAYGANMANLYIDVNPGTGWVNGVGAINGQQQISANQGWRWAQLTLNQYTNSSSVRIRFRAEYLGNGGDFAIDNVRIWDRLQTDAAAQYIGQLSSGCNLSATEQVNLTLQNKGTTDIFGRLDAAYQLSYISPQGVQTIYPVVRDYTIGTLVIPPAFYTFSFSQRANLSLPGKYTLKAWFELNGDSAHVNDTVTKTIINQSRGIPFYESWEEEELNEKFYYYFDNTLPSGWRSNNDPMSFFVSNSTNINGNTISGVSGSATDQFIVSVDNSNGITNTNSFLQSPCVDLRNISNADLEFWYYVTNSFQKILIDINDNSGWQTIDSIIPPLLNIWQKKQVSLSGYTGNFVNFRFRTSDVSGQAVLGIDSITIDSIVTTNTSTILNRTNNISLYPNPSNGMYYIESSRSLNGYEYQILDLHGRIVKRSLIKPHQNSFDLSAHTDGIYFLVIPELNVKKKLVKY